MRKNLRFVAFSIFLSFYFNSFVFAQDRFAYAITDFNQTTANWTVLRKLNLQTGIYSDVLLNGINSKVAAYDAESKKQINAVNASESFSTGVAAIAFDKRNDRIYYTPMFIDQLRYIDLKTMKTYYVGGQSFSNQKNINSDIAKTISRMTMAPDGYGYAISNDANNFIRFSTGKKLIIEQLGNLVDDPANKEISIHNSCSSWGGDIVADDDGNLYLLSARNNIFKINIQTKVATWLGTVKGLPADFTTNGLAVSDDGNLIAGSQLSLKSWYIINPKSWTATEFKTPRGVYLTSDLANSNYISTKKKFTDVAIIPEQSIFPGIIQIYPNPISISNNQFKIQFNKLGAGDYTIELTDVTGKQIMKQKINVTNEGEVQVFNLKNNTAQGIYLVKISDVHNTAVFTQKLVVQ
jgi:hypothetical protein